MKKTIGILGGMGPLATADLMIKITTATKASCDNEHIRVYVDSDCAIPDRTAAILHGGEDPVPEMSSALRHLEAHPELPVHLRALAAHARAGLKAAGLHVRESETPIVPIYTYDAVRTLQKAKEAYDAGVYVNPVLPPATAPGECLLRTSYMATLTEDLIDEAAGIIGKVLRA